MMATTTTTTISLLHSHYLTTVNWSPPTATTKPPSMDHRHQSPFNCCYPTIIIIIRSLLIPTTRLSPNWCFLATINRSLPIITTKPLSVPDYYHLTTIIFHYYIVILSPLLNQQCWPSSIHFSIHSHQSITTIQLF